MKQPKFLNAMGYSRNQVDSPFFKAADNQSWMFGLNNQTFGPFDTHSEAVQAFQAEQLITHGVR